MVRDFSFIFPSMSIAVSTVVMPSRRLALLMAGFCVGVAVVAWQLVFGPLIDLPLVLRITLTAILSVLPACAAYTAISPGKSLRIDISEHGEIRVAEDKTCRATGLQNGRGQVDEAGRQAVEGQVQDAPGAIARLLPDSTIWPQLLLLRLQTEGQGTRNVLVLRDSISAEHFRALSVACHWIAAHNDQLKR